MTQIQQNHQKNQRVLGKVFPQKHRRLKNTTKKPINPQSELTITHYNSLTAT